MRHYRAGSHCQDSEAKALVSCTWARMYLISAAEPRDTDHRDKDRKVSVSEDLVESHQKGSTV